MTRFDDGELLAELVNEMYVVPAVSYLQRRFGLSYLRAAELRERLASVLALGEPRLPVEPLEPRSTDVTAISGMPTAPLLDAEAEDEDEAPLEFDAAPGSAL